MHSNSIYPDGPRHANVLIRPAIAADYETICAIWNPIICDTSITFNPVPKTPQTLGADISDRRAAGYEFFVAEQGGAVIGFATYSQFRSGLGYAKTMEHTIILAPQAHGRGIGRMIMTSIETHARDQGARSLFGGVSAENNAGIAFHRAIGFEQAARLSQVGYKFGRWIDLILMQKFL